MDGEQCPQAPPHIPKVARRLLATCNEQRVHFILLVNWVANTYPLCRTPQDLLEMHKRIGYVHSCPVHCPPALMFSLLATALSVLPHHSSTTLPAPRTRSSRALPPTM